jgi:cell division septation protein DedD
MKNNETGEYELLVGNRQLLSGFFVVVLLFAVAFSMGYIVGRNSAPSAKLQAEASSPVPDTRPQPVSQTPAAPPAQPADAAQGGAASGVPPGPGAPPSDATPQPSTQPEREPQPAATAPATPTPPPEAAPGSYWQVLATASQTSADAMRQTLKDKGFPASLQPGPNNLIRVLIGPYTDKQSLGRAKTDLENAGVHPVLK